MELSCPLGIALSPLAIRPSLFGQDGGMLASFLCCVDVGRAGGEVLKHAKKRSCRNIGEILKKDNCFCLPTLAQAVFGLVTRSSLCPSP